MSCAQGASNGLHKGYRQATGSGDTKRQAAANERARKAMRVGRKGLMRNGLAGRLT